MAREIERKFLLRGDAWREGAEGVLYRQGYLSRQRERVLRVRTVGERGFLTIKGSTRGISRAEYEYEIPFHDAEEMLERLCDRPLIAKTRYRVEFNGLTWEIDEFHEENAGLILAEVELTHEDQDIELPEWIGKEVSGDPRYFNANLVSDPYSQWGEKQ